MQGGGRGDEGAFALLSVGRARAHAVATRIMTAVPPPPSPSRPNDRPPLRLRMLEFRKAFLIKSRQKMGKCWRKDSHNEGFFVVCERLRCAFRSLIFISTPSHEEMHNKAVHAKRLVRLLIQPLHNVNF
jgi:hypothetical protein